jgi:hypothetical protein
MKQVTVTLVGSVTYHASRSFILEMPDDVDLRTVDLQVLESIADEARVPWMFDSEGLIQATDHFLEPVSSETEDAQDQNDNTSDAA